MQIRHNYPLDSKSFGLRRFRHENGAAGVDFDEFLPPKRFLGSTWTKKQSCSSVQGLSNSENFIVLSLKLFKSFDFKQLSLKSSIQFWSRFSRIFSVETLPLIELN